MRLLAVTAAFEGRDYDDSALTRSFSQHPSICRTLSPCVTSAVPQNTPVCTRLPSRPPAGLRALARLKPGAPTGWGWTYALLCLSAGNRKHTAGVSFDPYMSLPTSDILDKCIGMDPFFWWSENALPNGIGVRYSREPPKG